MQDVQQTDTAAAPSGDIAQPEPSIGFDVDELFSQGTALPAAVEESAPDASAPPDGDADADEPTPDAAVDDDPEVDDAAPPADNSATVPPEQQVFDFAAIVAQNPNRLSEVPAKLRPEVVKALTQAAYVRGQQDSQNQFQRQSQTEEQTRSFVSERDEFARTSPDEFRAWQEENPAEAARYWAGKRYFAEKATKPEPQQSVSPQVIQERANVKLARVAQLPEAQRNAFAARVNAGEFPLTEAGLDALEAALFDAATEAARQAPAGTPQTAESRMRAEQRQRAAQSRAAAPKPVGMAGGGVNAQPDSYDPDELFAAAALLSARR